jgi:exopolyphosphatase / guanosine-5'-triphosphate,3'-diphosphate pyrophosphatase
LKGYYFYRVEKQIHNTAHEGGKMERIAVIDVGSNSIKLLVAELYSDGRLETVLDSANITKLGSGLKQAGKLNMEAMETSCRAISEFQATAEKTGACRVMAVGTMALRTAQNGTDFVNMVRDSSGLEIRVIPGEEEARLSYLAVVSGLNLGDGVIAVFDSGGGSTEFIFGSGNTITTILSANLGVVAISEIILKSDPVTPAEVEAALGYIKNILTEHKVKKEISRLVGVGGTVATMGAVKLKMQHYDPAAIHGSILELTEVNRQVALYSEKTLAERKNITGIQPGRADIILAGACIVKVTMELLEKDSIVISDRGIRHGLILDTLVRKGTP